MKKRLIRHIDIGGLRFKIKYPSKINKDIQEELGNGVVGYCDFHQREIVILKAEAVRDDVTLLHEIVHAILDSLSTTSLSQKESFVRPFAHLLYGALHQLGRIR